jgi:PST family polysaccharide transporter
LHGIVKDISKNNLLKIIANSFSLFIIQGSNYILPLILTPFLIKTVGLGRFGMISFAQSSTFIISVFIDYGFNLSATGEVSRNKNDEIFCANILVNITVIKFSIGIILFLPYTIFIYYSKYSLDIILFLFFYFSIFFQSLFPTWYFHGLENMKMSSYINMTAKTILLFLILLFVKNEKSIMFVPFFYFLTNIVSFLFASYILLKGINLKNITITINILKQHVVSGLSVFISSFFSNIISSSSLFILGIYKDNEVVGMYSAIDKLVKAVLGLFYPITRAIYPYFSRSFVKDYRKALKTLRNIATITIFVSIIFSVLIDLFHKSIFSLFIKTLNIYNIEITILLLSVWIIIGVANNFIGIQYLLNMGERISYRNSYIISGSISLVIFLFFTPCYSFNAIAFGLVLGELILLIQLLYYSIMKHKSIIINSADLIQN